MSEKTLPARRRRFDVGPGSWMDRFTEAHGTASSLLGWGRRTDASNERRRP